MLYSKLGWVLDDDMFLCGAANRCQGLKSELRSTEELCSYVDLVNGNSTSFRLRCNV